MFKELDELLSKECSVDLWSDDLILLADKVAAKFSEADWLTLSNTWHAKPEEWQLRSIQVVGEFQRSDVRSILLRMVAGPYEEVKYAARNILREQYGMKF